MSNLGIMATTSATLPGLQLDLSLVSSAAHAGGIGVLDCQFVDDVSQIVDCLKSLAGEPSAGSIGIKLDLGQLESLKPCLAVLSDAGLRTAGGGIKNIVVLCASIYEAKALASAIKIIHSFGLSAFVEAVNLNEAKIAEAARADAVIAKGHESGGRVGDETTFVLLQRLVAEVKVPVWAQGGIGLHTAAACYVGGAAGVVLDAQLLLTRQSSLPVEAKAKVARMDGSETVLIAQQIDDPYRLYSRPGLKVIDELNEIVAQLEGGSNQKATSKPANKSAAFDRAIKTRIRDGQVNGRLANGQFDEQPWFLGQDVAFAFSLAEKYVTVSGVMQAIWQEVDEHVKAASELNMLASGSALAQSHGTKYPIVQGAMTRVSDTADFALAVAGNGALPFLALALMRKAEVEKLLAETSEKLKGQSWGVGILGFVPNELRQEQMEVVNRYKPPYALIAGGRPDQAQALEDMGTHTYLHVPSPLLLKSFLESGCRRFIFEGKECGGHVGPRSSFVLWESMIDVLLSSIPAKEDAGSYHIVFAGGIHDAISAAMVAALSAPLAKRGVRVGLLMGTAYLFTQEAVESGAIVNKFQQAALKCEQTVLLETGPGHSIRCIGSPYKETFESKRRQLEAQKKSKEDVRQELELMNLGRLRIASKGLTRDSESNSGNLVNVAEEKQWADGMYMIGQVAAMHKDVLTIAGLHDDVCQSGNQHLKDFAEKASGKKDLSSLPNIAIVDKTDKRPQDVAIIGMSCLFPKANDLETYWNNILNKVDAIEEIPKEQWDFEPFYDADPMAADKIYSKWGGFLKDIIFDPTTYGIPPSSLAAIDPMQILMLEVTRAALNDAGYGKRPFSKERTSVILANAGHAPITAFYSLRSMLDWKLKDLDPALRKAIQKQLPEWTEDTFPGFLGNVAAGRVANRFDLTGINFSVDAACASSLAALYIGLRELRAGTSDVALVAATDTHNQPGDYLSFSKVHALSPRGRCRTFDATADGIAISEGVAMIVLKRLADAERDGDRIYAVIKGMGGSSDGRDLSLTAPRPAGQVLSLTRAYADAQVSPSTVGLIEAHGTGTVVGDRTELEALRQVFDQAGADRLACAVGSVKSMIGHTKAAAGLASVIKIAKALHHKILPPTIGVETPNAACDLVNGPFFIATESRPWINSSLTPRARRAGISAFGFGGTNFHTVLEEYVGLAQSDLSAEMPTRQLPSEIFAWKADSRADLLRAIATLADGVQVLIEEAANTAAGSPDDANKVPALTKLAYANYLRFAETSSANKDQSCNLALVATSLDDLKEKLAKAKTIVADESKQQASDPKGVYFTAQAPYEKGKVAMLFPGQGSQKINMLLDLSLYFPEVRTAFEQADSALAHCLDKPLSTYVFPAQAFSKEDARAQELSLTDTHIAQPAIAAADVAAFRLLSNFGLKADMVAGHSFGEYVALWAASVFNDAELFQIAEKRGQLLAAASSGNGTPGTMAAVTASVAAVKNLLSSMPEITLANINAPNQCIIAGERQAVERAIQKLNDNQLPAKLIAVSAAFHSPHMVGAQGELKGALSKLDLASPRLPVYSNTDANPHPNSPATIAQRLVEHLIRPVEFVKEVEELYADGARVFIEVGPGSVLTNLVDSILEGKAHLAVACERSGRSGVTQLQHVLAQLICAAVPVNLSRLYQGRLQTLSDISGSKTANQQGNQSGKVRQKLLYLVNGAKFQALAGNPSVSSSASSTSQVNIKKEIMSEPKSTAQTASSMAPHKESSSLSNPLPNQHATANATATRTGFAGAANASGHGNGGKGAGNGRREGNGYERAVRKSVETSDMEQVMFKFQQTMAEMTASFLETQQNVMLAYLQAKSGGKVEITNQNLANLNLANQNRASQEMMLEAMAKLNAPQFTALPVDGNGNGHSTHTVDSTFVGAAAAANNNGHDVVNNDLSGNGAAAKGIDADELVAKFLEIVSERTGYPPEMLDLNLDMEADLGIDSIKRVEVLSTFRKLLPEETQKEMEGSVEKLAGTKTLQAIIDWIRAFIAETAGSPQASSASSLTASSNNGADRAATSHGAVQTPQKMSSVSRAIVQTRELPALAASPIVCPGVIVITDDERGIAKEILQTAKKSKQKAVILQQAKKAAPAKDGIYQADLTNLDHVQAVLKHITEEHGQINGLIHLLSFAEADKFAQAKNGDGVMQAQDVRSLFVLAKALEPTFKQNPKQSFVIAATNLGGDFASISSPVQNLYVQQAGVVGVIKSLAKEWPEITSKVVDFALDAKPAVIAGNVLAEAFAYDEEVEVGYFNQSRITIDIAPTALAQEQSNDLAIDSASVILVTGGARGITAELACELAVKHQPKLVIVGRSPRPDGKEPKQLAGITNARDLKAAIMEMLRSEGKAVSIGAVESVYQKLLRDREIVGNLKKLEDTGASVHYFACDVTDTAAFAELIDNVYDMFGKIDGVIHGAGVIEDNYVKDKSPESFDRVFFTKVTSALTLSHKLRLTDLKFLVLMSSVVGRTGNAGQTDYVAANEVVNKLARTLRQKTNARVTSIMWGPWNGGMARAELAGIFASYGWSMIEPIDGRNAFASELKFGGKDDVEVLLVGLIDKANNNGSAAAAKKQAAAIKGNGKYDGNGYEVKAGSNGHEVNGDGNGHGLLPADSTVTGARMYNSTLVSQEPGRSEFMAVVGPAFDLYLNDHTFDNVPVMPMAFALEMMLESAKQVYPDWNLVRLQKLDIPSGIVFDADTKNLTIIVAEESRNDKTLLAKLSVNTGATAKRAHFRVTAEFSKLANVDKPGVPFIASVDQLVDRAMHIPSVADAYRDWLFHGPMFQGIEEIAAIGSNGIVGAIRTSAPAQCLAKSNGQGWVLDPIFLDSAMQLAGIWARKFLDMTCIPTGFRQLHFLGPTKGSEFKVRVFIPEETRENILRCDLAIWNEDGTPVIWIEDLGGIGSKSLNRLADQPKGAENAMTADYRQANDRQAEGKPSKQVAIIGMSCLYPEAGDLSSFWSNIVNGRDAIREASVEEWGTPADQSKLPYCKRGGFITEFAEFDPMQCGVMPNSVQGADPDQFLALKVALETLKDAGYAGKDFNREKAEVILGRISAPGAGSFNFIQQNGVTDQVVALIGNLFPHLTADELAAVSAEIEKKMPQSNADSIVSVMPNVLAGRIANRLDFRGRNLVLDAACASSLIAVQIAVEDLLSGKADLVLTGGLHVNSSLFFFKLFAGLGALSRKEMIRPFDAQSDGTILGEGVGMVLLKRLEDAVADGDRIYAVIRGVGSSSDGHGTSMLAPSVDGEVLALERAYEMAGISPTTIGLLEAHGTGTPEGDLVELKAIEKVFAGKSNQSAPWLALGSVKSMIGHTQAAAGVAGLIKASLALYHQTLPPTLNVSEPNPKIDWLKSPCYLLGEARPWIHPYYQGLGDHPRRAAVSAFGFGGVNAHVVLEEHIDLTAAPAADLVHKWDTEVCLFKAANSQGLIEQIDQLLAFLAGGDNVLLKDVAYSAASIYVDEKDEAHACCLAVVASSVLDLQAKLKSARVQIEQKSNVAVDGAASGIYYSRDAAKKNGKLAFLLPGLGAAYPNMLSDLCLHFTEVREVFDFADYLAVSIAENDFPSNFIFPKQFTRGRKPQVSSATLASMDSAVITLLLAEWAIFHLLQNLGIEADAVMGCSTGEFAAMPMSGTTDILAAAGLFYKHSTAVARSFPVDKVKDLRSLMVAAPAEKVSEVLNRLARPMYVTADMSPSQVIITGHLDAAEEALAALQLQGIHVHKMPSAIPYHTPLVDDTTCLEPEGFQDLPMTAPIIDAWACSTAAKLPNDEEGLRKMSTTLFRHPIQFRKTVELMYEDGVRIFVEVGPRDNLTPHVKEILAGKPHTAAASNVSTRSAIAQINHLLASLAISGVNVKADYLFVRRSPKKINFAQTINAKNALGTVSRQVKLDLKYPVIPTNLPVAIKDLLLSQEELIEYENFDGGEPAIADGMDAVMESYLNTVSSFQNNLMQVQQKVLAEFFQQSQQIAEQESAAEEIDSEAVAQEERFELPFLRHAGISRQGEFISVQRALTLTEDRYLLDHAIGGVVSTNSNDKVFLLPLMVALEMMAEGAQELVADKTLVQIKQVRANKRIRVDSNGCALTVNAKLKTESASTSIVEAEIKSAGEGQGKECLMSCQLVFDYEQVLAPEGKISLINGNRPRLTKSQLYGPDAMFHGPTMQSVIELSQVSERKISGLVKVRPAYDWFASDPSFEYGSSFLIDPLLIDNASQLVYFHLLENDKQTSALLPFLIEKIDFYADSASNLQEVKVKAELATISERNTEARIEIANDEGQLLMSIEGIHSKRIQLPQVWSDFIADPKLKFLAQPVSEITSRLPATINWYCLRVNDDDMPADLGTLEWCADYVLSESERLEFISASKVEKRKREWLAGRIAAKDAVRQLLQAECGITVCPADIEILQDENGRPLPYGLWVEKAGFVPQLSITHGDGIAYALTSRPSPEFIAGMDTEPARNRGSAFEEMAFTDGELKLLALMTAEERQAGNTAFWCAKEAIAKAIGMGLAGKPKEFEVVAVNWQAGTLTVAVHQSDVFVHNSQLLVHCLIEDERVTAFTACQLATQ